MEIAGEGSFAQGIRILNSKQQTGSAKALAGKAHN